METTADSIPRHGPCEDSGKGLLGKKWKRLRIIWRGGFPINQEREEKNKHGEKLLERIKCCKKMFKRIKRESVDMWI